MCTDVFLFMQVKQPGLEMSTVQSELDLSYGQRYQGVKIPEAYERLILDTYDLISILNSESVYALIIKLYTWAWMSTKLVGNSRHDNVDLESI